MNVLISVKPIFYDKISEGLKKYEFRKISFKKTDIDKVYIYVSAPVQKITGYFKYTNAVTGNKTDVWNKTKDNAGISFEKYSEYFQNHENAVAYYIEEFIKFPEGIIPTEKINNFYPPQSFMYLDKDL